jgi:hypothetical protein
MQQNNYHEALVVAEESYQLASNHGYVAIVKQILPVLKKCRKAC